ncbi:MAG: Replication factor C small subunit, partial [Candidatus Thermoplasmatota archaeon]
YLKYIGEQEKLKLTEEGLEAIVYIAGGDMRRAISALQVAASDSKKIDENSIYKITSTAKPEEVKTLLELALKGDFLKARETLDELLIEYGLSGEDIIKQIHRTIFDLNIPDETKVQLIDRAGEIEFRIVEGANERIQLETLLAYFALAGSRRR